MGGGYASTYATRINKIEKKREVGKHDGKFKLENTKEQGKKQSEYSQSDAKDEKLKPRTRKLECFICGNEH
jgi:hypothetical protein